MQFEELPIVKDFDHESKKQIISYIRLMYDESSSLNSIEDLEQRKEKACQKAGLDYDDPEVKDIIDLKDENIFQLVHHYHITNNSNKYYSWCSHQHLFWEIQQKIMDPAKPTKEKTSLLSENDAILERMDKLRSEIWPTLNKVATEKVSKRAIAPEQRVKRKNV